MKRNPVLSLIVSLLLLASCQTGNTKSVSSLSSEVPFSYEVPVSSSFSEASPSDYEPVSSSLSFSPVSSSSGSSVYTSVPDSAYSELSVSSYWKGLNGKAFGNTFRKELQALIKKTGNRSIPYGQNKKVLAGSDKALNGKGIIPFYRSDDNSTTNWNREHVWPNSRGAGSSGIGSDPHMLRPTNINDNSSRSNYFYGQSGDGKVWDPASFGYEPSRGESARIIFYVATKYYLTCGKGGSSHGDNPVELSNNPNDATSRHTMGRLDRLIEWNNKYPVTDQEKRRNEYLYKEGFGRNPFIDYPDFANYIWDKQGLRTSPYDGSLINEEEEPELKKEYTRIQLLDDLKEAGKVAIIANGSQSGTVYGALADEPENERLPWYLKADNVSEVKDTKAYSSKDLVMSDVGYSSEDGFTFHTERGYPFHYVSESHKATLKGKDGVYLSYSEQHDTFQGNKRKPTGDSGFFISVT